ncbi:MAG: acyltransferase family protein, partial [Leptospiraceae bacterium]|nr:acyltransferase family protein [Leptospiraceae bacterium]
GIGYTVKSKETSEVYTWFALLTHTFRMPLFFLLSGFFSELVLSKKGRSDYINSRLRRIFIPLLFALVLFAPIDGYFRLISGNKSINLLEYYLTFFFQSTFTFSHIWFLYYLLIFSFLYLKFRNYILHVSLLNKNFLFYSSLILFLSILIPNLFFNKEDFIFQIRPMFFFYYLTFFLLGAYIYHYQLLDFISFNFKQYVVLLSLLGVLFGVYMYLEEVDQYWMSFLYNPKQIGFRVIHLLIEVSLALGWSLISISLARQFLNFQNYFTTELVNSLLPVYLVHHPISIVLGYILGTGGFLQREVALVLHIFLVITISFSFYIVTKHSKFLSFMMGLKFKEKEISQAPVSISIKQ